MSSNSFTDKCPKCGSDEMNVCHDSRPYFSVSGECLECGFGYLTEEYQETLDHINEFRVNIDLEPLKKFRKQEGQGR